MSSHHVVREGQEPALFIIEPISYGRVAPLLEWSPLIMVTDAALENVLSWGIRIDAVACDPRNRSDVQAMIADAQQVEIVEAKDQLLDGLRWLSNKNQFAVTLAGRDPHTLDRIDEETYHGISFIDPAMRWIPVVGEFKKWVPARTTFRLLHTPQDCELTVTNGEVSGELIISKDDGLVTIRSSCRLWLGEVI
jgi:hypothetical protein